MMGGAGLMEDGRDITEGAESLNMFRQMDKVLACVEFLAGCS